MHCCSVLGFVSGCKAIAAVKLLYIMPLADAIYGRLHESLQKSSSTIGLRKPAIITALCNICLISSFLGVDFPPFFLCNLVEDIQVGLFLYSSFV